MTNEWPPCPAGKRRQHAIMAIYSDNPEAPILLVCQHCGMSQHQTFTPMAPLDDMDAEDIKRLAARERG